MESIGEERQRKTIGGRGIYGKVSERLLYVVALTGELPQSALRLLGNYNSYVKTQLRLEKNKILYVRRNRQKEQGYVDEETGEIKTKRVKEPVKRIMKGIRLNVDEKVPLAEQMTDTGLLSHEFVYELFGEELLEHNKRITNYSEGASQPQAGGRYARVYRDHRLAESMVMMLNAGVVVEPWKYPGLKATTDSVVYKGPLYIDSRTLKNLDGVERDEANFSKIQGIFLSPGGYFSVYNMHRGLSNWKKNAELKMQGVADSITLCCWDMPDKIYRSDSDRDGKKMMLITKTDKVILSLLSYKSSRPNNEKFTLDCGFVKVCYVPLCIEGSYQIRMMSYEDWEETLQEKIFEKHNVEPIPYSHIRQGRTEDGIDVGLWFDADVNRLPLIKAALRRDRRQKYRLYILNHHAPLIKEYFSKEISDGQVELITATAQGAVKMLEKYTGGE